MSSEPFEPATACMNTLTACNCKSDICFDCADSSLDEEVRSCLEQFLRKSNQEVARSYTELRPGQRKAIKYVLRYVLHIHTH